MIIVKEGTISIGPHGHMFVSGFTAEFSEAELATAAQPKGLDLDRQFRMTMEDRVLAAAKRIADSRAKAEMEDAEGELAAKGMRFDGNTLQ